MHRYTISRFYCQLDMIKLHTEWRKKNCNEYSSKRVCTKFGRIYEIALSACCQNFKEHDKGIWWITH